MRFPNLSIAIPAASLVLAPLASATPVFFDFTAVDTPLYARRANATVHVKTLSGILAELNRGASDAYAPLCAHFPLLPIRST
jgi:hypothetical protein